MKDTGIVRKVDELGRIVIPIEFRKLLDIDIKDPVEIYADDQYIVIKKYSSPCHLCGGQEKVKLFRGKNSCQDCIDLL